jgi:hypothetical protein
MKTNFAAKKVLGSLVYDEHSQAYRIEIRDVRVWFRTATEGRNGDIVLYNDVGEEIRSSVIQRPPFELEDLQAQMRQVKRHGNNADAVITA